MRKALLIACSVKGLEGGAHDLALMRSALENKGFEATVLEGDLASRVGILRAFEELILNAPYCRAICVYFTGHGLSIPLNAGGETRTREWVKMLIPSDFEAGGGADARVIFDREFALFVARLTDACRNLTIFLDCCFSGRFVRDDVRNKALSQGDLNFDLASASAYRRQLPLRFPNGNPFAVRYVACGFHQKAIELGAGSEKKHPVSLFTLQLTRGLDFCDGPRTTWQHLAGWVGEAVRQVHWDQRPSLEGPGNRFLFSLQEDPNPGGYCLFFMDGQFPSEPAVNCGLLHGAKPGAVFLLKSLGEAAEVQGEARITEVFGDFSKVLLEPRWCSPGLAAVPMTTLSTLPALGVRGDLPAWVKMVLPPGSGSDIEEPAVLEAEGECVKVRDWRGGGYIFSAADASHLFDLLSRSAWLYHLKGEKCFFPKAFAHDFQLHFLKFEKRGGKQRVFPETTFKDGDFVGFEMNNLSPVSLFVCLLYVDDQYERTILTREERHGVEVLGNEKYCFGFDMDSVWLQWEVTWEGDFRGLEKRETIVALISDGPIETGSLEMAGVGADLHGAFSRSSSARPSQAVKKMVVQMFDLVIKC